MRPYMRLGDVPRKRHVYVEREGRPLYEELVGRQGFSGASSLLYHLHMPEAAHAISPEPSDEVELAPAAGHTHAHLRAHSLHRHGCAVTGRQWLLVNDDVRIGVAVPSEQQERLFVDASADQVLFMHEGGGRLDTQFGRLDVRCGDCVVIPRGTIHRLHLDDPASSRILIVACAGEVDSPARYRAANGQLTEMAPYSERDVRSPTELALESSPSDVWVERAGSLTRYEMDHHPFDVVGWDGTVYPIALNVHDFEPRAGRFHVPPPMHQLFAATNVVICVFVPRRIDWDSEANILPYHHSNLDSDEVMYYAEGEYRARRGIDRGSITLHVGGVPHGPQPGALEASRNAPRIVDELAVMVDTFRPLRRTATAMTVNDPTYPYSWHGGG